MKSRAWLPAEALPGAAARSVIEAALEDWSAAWFASRARLRLTALRPAERPVGDHGQLLWQHHLSDLCVAIAPAALARLRAKALDLSMSVRAQGGREAELLADFDKKMIADLARRVEAALGKMTAAPGAEVDWSSEPAGALGEAIWVTVGEPGRPDKLQLFIPVEHVIAFRKAHLPPPRLREKPAEIARALGRSKIRIEGRLGTAELRLEELRDLAPGDVLVLDRRVDEAAELVAGRRPLARARLDTSEVITLIVEPQE